jgi:2',3'-cyclic-nucleotide 2'-phosphodiesterase/3'-nucleotidase
MLKGSEIKDILEYSSDLFYNTVHKKGDRLLKTVTYDDGTVGPEIYLGNFITAAGIDYTVDVTKPAGSRVNILSMADGSKFDLNRMYRTTMSSYTYFGAESPLFKATGLKRKDLPRRLNGASSIDIRYYMLTDFALNGNTGVKVTYPVHRKLIPEALVQDCLGKDTLNFSFIH